MLGFAVERDLQTLHMQAKAGSHLSNLSPAFHMLHSPGTNHRNLFQLCIAKDGADPPVIPPANALAQTLWKVFWL